MVSLEGYRARYDALEMVPTEGKVYDELGPLEGDLEGKVPKDWTPRRFTLQYHRPFEGTGFGHGVTNFGLSPEDSGNKGNFQYVEGSAKWVSDALGLSDPAELVGRPVVGFFKPGEENHGNVTLVSFL